MNRLGDLQKDTSSQYEVQIKEEKPASAEGEMDAVKSVWLTNKRTGKVFRVCVTNPMAEAQWGKMNGEKSDAVDVPLSQIAAADKAMIVSGDNVKIIVEGCPDGLCLPLGQGACLATRTRRKERMAFNNVIVT